MGQNFNFTQQTVTDATIWNATAGAVEYTSEGGAFSIRRRFDSPTIQSNFYIFFGTVEVIMKAASGQGIISSIVLESDDLDEIDWELMGGNTTHAETNYFGKGNTTSFDRAIYYPISEPQKNFHNYTIDWTAEKIDWLIDGTLVRSLKYGEANGGHNFPQTPMNVRLGIWAGGDPSMPNGTVEWAGGHTDFSAGPYTMWVSSVKVKDASKGSSYTYGDRSGSWQSIKVARYNLNSFPQLPSHDANKVPISGNSTIATALSAPPPLTLNQRYQALPKAAQIAIIAGSASLGAALFGLLLFCCIKQRRAGRREREIADAAFQKEHAQMMMYRKQMSGNPNVGHGMPGMGSGIPMNGYGGSPRNRF